MEKQPLLVAKGLSKKFIRADGRSVDVFKGIDFEIHAGERVAIVGKSGAGKSTFLHLLGTLEEPSSGTVHFQGKNIFALKEADLSRFRNTSIGFVFQMHYLMLEFTALENVMMPALLGGKGKKEAQERARSLLSKVGLEKRLDHKPSQMSGGEQQRVAIARALMMRPKLLLTDEMTGNLDPITGKQIFDLIEALHSEHEVALVSVTHDQKLASSYPKVYSLEQGTLRRVTI